MQRREPRSLKLAWHACMFQYNQTFSRMSENEKNTLTRYTGVAALSHAKGELFKSSVLPSHVAIAFATVAIHKEGWSQQVLLAHMDSVGYERGQQLALVQETTARNLQQL